MIKCLLLASFLSTPVAILANQGVNLNQPPMGNPPPEPNQAQYQQPQSMPRYQQPPPGGNTQPLNVQQPEGQNAIKEDTELTPAEAKEAKPGTVLVDIKTEHGSILIKKLDKKDAKTPADTARPPDARRDLDTTRSVDAAVPKTITK